MKVLDKHVIGCDGLSLITIMYTLATPKWVEGYFSVRELYPRNVSGH